MSEQQLFPNETILPDDNPVHAGYLYVVDGRVIESDVSGTVRHLKADLRNFYKLPALEVRRCDIQGRIDQRAHDPK